MNCKALVPIGKNADGRGGLNGAVGEGGAKRKESAQWSRATLRDCGDHRATEQGS